MKRSEFYSLPEDITKDLINKSEHGSGYQYVTIILKSGIKIQNRLVFNCDKLLLGINEESLKNNIKSIIWQETKLEEE